MNNYTRTLLTLILVTNAACAPHIQSEYHPCAMANAPITLDNLLLNSASQSYELCLAFMRELAAVELRN